jgi:RNase P subunit RPR2
MSCKKCDYKGFIESSYFANNKEYTYIMQCKECNDIKAYSNEVLIRTGVNVSNYKVDRVDNVVKVDFTKRHGKEE